MEGALSSLSQLCFQLTEKVSLVEAQYNTEIQRLNAALLEEKRKRMLAEEMLENERKTTLSLQNKLERARHIMTRAKGKIISKNTKINSLEKGCTLETKRTALSSIKSSRVKYLEAKDGSTDSRAMEEAHSPGRTEHSSDSDDGRCPSPSLLFTALRSEEAHPFGSPVCDMRDGDAQSLDVTETLPASPELGRSFGLACADNRPPKCNRITRTPPGEAVVAPGGTSADTDGLAERTCSTHKHRMPLYKFVQPVRGKSKRQKLDAKPCPDCSKWYAVSCGLKRPCDHVKDTCRHRALHLPPDSDPRKWEVSFPSTEECEKIMFPDSDIAHDQPL